MGRGRTTEESFVVGGANVVVEILRAGVPIERLLAAPGGRADEVVAVARARGVAVERADRDMLGRLVPAGQHQGVVAVLPPFRYADLETLLVPATRLLVFLDGLQDPRNVGAIVRTARAAGAGGVVLPRDRSVGVTPAVVTASAGLVFDLPVARVTNLVRALEEAKEAGFWTVGLAAGDADLYSLDAPDRLALVVGAEGEGLRPLVARHCDFKVGIPMAAGVESLNASVAAGIALYQLAVAPRSRSRER